MLNIGFIALLDSIKRETNFTPLGSSILKNEHLLYILLFCIIEFSNFKL
jgi:hypothetical protein